MNMLKIGYGIVLDGLLDIPEFHFRGVWVPPDPILLKCYISEIFECLKRHMSESQAYRGSLQESIEKEMCHLKAEKNKIISFCMFPEPGTISLLCLLMYMYFLFILLPHFVLIMYVPILK